jgi:hypothetical protein
MLIEVSLDENREKPYGILDIQKWHRFFYAKTATPKLKLLFGLSRYIVPSGCREQLYVPFSI